MGMLLKASGIAVVGCVALAAIGAIGNSSPPRTPQEAPSFFTFLTRQHADQSVIQEMLLSTLPADRLAHRRAVFVDLCTSAISGRSDHLRLFPQARDIPAHCGFLFEAGHELNFFEYMSSIGAVSPDAEEQYLARLRA